MAALSGMKQITSYMGKSEATVLKLIREYGFPARMVLGVWESDSDLIVAWRLRLIAGDPQQAPSNGPDRLATR